MANWHFLETIDGFILLEYQRRSLGNFIKMPKRLQVRVRLLFLQVCFSMAGGPVKRYLKELETFLHRHREGESKGHIVSPLEFGEFGQGHFSG